MIPLRDHNPSERVPFVTYTLLAANLLVFLAMLVIFPDEIMQYKLYNKFGMVPEAVSMGEGLFTILTSIFLHAGGMHLAGNLLFLWIFGDNMEDEMGHLPFLIFYLACGVGASLAQWATDPFSIVPVVGASGAIAGVMGGYLLLFPRARVDFLLILVIFFRIIPVPAWLMLGIWLGFQLISGLVPGSVGGGVAHWAHVGGFVFGFVFCLPLWLRLGGTGFWRETHGAPPHPEAQYARSSVPVVRRR